jgi:hypothetical protein
MKKIFTLALLLINFQLWASPEKPLAAPTTTPTNFNASSTDGDRINVNWNVGNGAKRIVIARKEAAPTFIPSNGVNYNANAAFGSGNEVANGEFVVYNNTGNSVAVTNLQPNTQYYFSIFEYNGTGTGIEFLTTLTITNGFTIAAPTGQVSNLVSSNVIGHSLKLSWTNPPVAVAGAGRIVIGREGAPVNVNPQDLAAYVSNTQFGSGTEIGSGNFVIAKTNSTNITVENLKPNTAYHFAIFEYKGNSGLVFNIVNPPAIVVTTLPRPTVNASSPVFTNIDGNTMKITINKGNGARRIIVAKAGSPVMAIPVDGTTYNANTVFGTAGTEMALGEYVLLNGAADNISITGLAKATTYYFAVFEYDGSGNISAYLTITPLETSQATVSAPTLQVSNISFPTILNSSVTINWTNGNGSRRMIIMKKDAPVTAVPNDLSQYGSSATFGAGTNMGNGNYVVYSNNGNSATVTGLAAGATYHLAMYEFNGSSAPVYLTNNPVVAQFTTGQSPTQVPNTLEWSNTEGNRLTVNWGNGNGSSRIVVVKAGSAVTGVPVNGTVYAANASFGNSDQIAPGEYVVMNANNNQTTFTNLALGTTYHVAVFEYNVVSNLPYYLTTPGISNKTTVSSPTTQSSSMQFTNVIGNSMKLTWTKGNGAYRIVIAKAGSPVDAVPANFSSYNDNSAFGSGTQLGNGNYTVYSGTGNSVTMTGLQPGVTYHFAVFEFNGLTYPVYLTNTPLVISQQTADRPGVASGNFSFPGIEGNKMTIRWTSGNGTKRILVGRAGGPVTALPQDGTDYTNNLVFGSGQEILPGQFVLADGNSFEATVTNLQPATVYHFALFEYDGTGANIRYLTAMQGTANQATLSAPPTGPSNVLFSAIGTTTATVNWTTATADKHLVVIRKDAPVTALPQQLMAYSSHTGYGLSSTLMAPEHYVLYNSSATSTSATGLQPGVAYHISVFAFNGTLGPMYNTTNIASSSFTTLGPPTNAANSVMITSGGNGSAVNISWTNGTGQRRLVLMKAASAVNALPAENISYVANTFFGSGQQLGSGNFVVYNGTGDNVTVNNLQKNQVYHIAVFEYNQFATGPIYLTTTFAQGQFVGFILPIKLASFTGLAQQTKNLLQWSTSQEVNAKEFIVERSVDGWVFESIGAVAAKGNSNVLQSYQFEDRKRSAINFYRLRMVDVNGKSEYSVIIRLQTSKEEGLKLFPTLATISVQLNFEMKSKGSAIVRVVDMSGKIIVQQNMALDAGIISRTIDVSSLIAGNYLLQIDAEGKTSTAKFIKQ